MINSLFQAILKAGTQYVASDAEKRDISLANFISFIIGSAFFASIFIRLTFYQWFYWWFLAPLITQGLLFYFLIYLNHKGFSLLGKFLLSCLPPLCILYNTPILMNSTGIYETADYVGFRLLLVSFACIPFLIYHNRQWKHQLFAIAFPLASIIFYDPILTALGIGYWDMGLKEVSYSYSTVRSLISFAIISSAFLFLKTIIEKQERFNLQLINELREKNLEILEKTSAELNSMDQQLVNKVEELQQRELALEESQRIAKMGSWEYNRLTNKIFWSRQLYELLEVDYSTPAYYPPLSLHMLTESADTVNEKFNQILEEGEALDITLALEINQGQKKWIRIIGHPNVTHQEVIGSSGIIHDVSYFMEAEEKVAASERNYQSLFEQASDAIMVSEANGNFIDANSAMLSMLGYTKDEFLMLNIRDIIDGKQLQEKPIPFSDLLAGGRVTNERLMLHKNGSKVAVEVNAKRFGTNQLIGIARNISERRDTAQRLMKYNHELSLLNTVNHLISRVKTIEELFTALCEILVKEGGYMLAWIAPDRRREGNAIIKPLYASGTAIAYAEALNIDMNDPQQSLGPSAQSLIQGKLQIVNEIVNEERFRFWRKRAQAFGLQASMSTPIVAEPVATYLLCLYSDLPNAFDPSEVEIIERLVLNTATAIKSIHTTQEHDRAKRELEYAFEKLNYHITNTPLAVIERDKDLNITFWNKRAEEIFGWRAEEVLGKKAHEILSYSAEEEKTHVLISSLKDQKLRYFVQQRKNFTKNGSPVYSLWYYSIVRDRAEQLQTVLSFVSDITEQKNAAYQLSERLKELTALYKVSQLLSYGEKSLKEIIEDTVGAIKEGFQYPAICEVRIEFMSFRHQTNNFRMSTAILKELFFIAGVEVGAVEVVYTENTVEGSPVSFFQEEKSMLRVMVEMLQIYFIKRQEGEALQQSQANLDATINNTELLIWSVDRHFRLLMFNKPFVDYNKNLFDVDVFEGLYHSQIFPSPLAKQWEERYSRALTGEVFVFEESREGIDFRFSLSPIIEKKIITGVSVFAENITEQNVQAKALFEANKVIADLRVMALRSVMNPHFIFNVLNSIQFFIANNDRLNAINYLSTFSKLIRMILTHSVSDSINLSEELELLKNYVELEKVRFEDKFNFSIHVEDGLMVDDIHIPSLLIQPYVENAILHGLCNKEGGKGLLQISVSQEKDFLAFVIEDNGVGRQAAEKLKHQHQAKHKSIGTKLTEERLKWINQGSAVSVVYDDLIKQDIPAGTRVTIQIKIEE